MSTLSDVMDRGAAGISGGAADYAIEASAVTKAYKLYPSLRHQALDVIGLYGLVPGRLRKSFPEFQALSGINLRIDRGERVGIIGRNGAGKTTFLKLITGMIKPSAGSMKVQGNVQALMQVGIGFHPDFSGLENIRASLLSLGLSDADREEAEEDIIDFCELGDFLNQPLRTYSLGMQSRLQFACATSIKPEILIVDEILGAGDAYFSVKSARRMERLTGSGCTLLLVSHAMQQIIQFCERAVWIESGRIKMDGEVRDVVGAYEVAVAEDVKKSKFATLSEPAKLPKDDGDEAKDNDTRPDFSERGDDARRYQETLLNGMAVFRWTSNKGVKIVDINVQDEDGETHVFRSGQPLTIDLLLECEVDEDLTIQTHVAIFDEMGVRVTWMTSPPDSFSSMRGKQRCSRMVMPELLLSEGKYVLSISIFNCTHGDTLSEATRLDLLARCYNFAVIAEEKRDRPVFYHPSQWRFSDVADRQAAE